jgi:hypothetical protein
MTRMTPEQQEARMARHAAFARQEEIRSAAVKAVGCPDCGSGPGEPCDIPDLPPAAGTWSVVHRARDRATGIGPRVHRALS